MDQPDSSAATQAPPREREDQPNQAAQNEEGHGQPTEPHQQDPANRKPSPRRREGVVSDPDVPQGS